MTAEPTTQRKAGKNAPTWRSRQFLGPVIAIGAVQLAAAMDGPILIFALPRIQNELGLTDAERGWVLSSYLLTFGGLILLGGRLGDAIGRKRIFIVGVALFTVASAVCSIAWTGDLLVVARLLHGAAGAIVAPTCTALLATTFPKGPTRNAATAVFGAMASIGVVSGLVLGGVLTGISWRLAFWLNVPIGLLVIFLARTMVQETEKARMKLDVAGAVLATLGFTAGVFALSIGPEKGWLSAPALGLGAVAAVALVSFVVVERTAENPIVPFSLFVDRSRLATYGSMFLSSGVGFTLTVLIALYMQNIMGYSPLRAGLSFIPLSIAMAVGTAVSARLVMRFSPRTIVIIGALLLLGGMLYGGLHLNHNIPYFPNMLLPIVVGAIGIGMINVPLGLALVGSVGLDRIGPASAIIVMMQSIGGPLVLAVIQIVITFRTLQLGGTTGPASAMDASQLHALEVGYTFGLICLAVVTVVLCIVALFIGYTAQQVAHAQKMQKAMEEAEVGVAEVE